MGKRNSKALKPKRRWLGVGFDSRYEHKKDFIILIDDISRELQLERPLKLFDFVKSDCSEIDNLNYSGFFGVAIIQVALVDVPRLRKLFNERQSASTYGVVSLTTSGKIRLVRERLNIKRTA